MHDATVVIIGFITKYWIYKHACCNEQQWLGTKNSMHVKVLCILW